MIKLGNDNIGKIYLGNNVIGKAYLGNNLIYQEGGHGPLPYTPVTYIETDGAAYINTGIKGNSPRSFKMRILPMNAYNDTLIIGTRVSASVRMIPLELFTSKKAGFAYNSGAYNPLDITASVNNRTPMEVMVHLRNGSQQIGIKQQGESDYTTYSRTVTGDCTTGLNIFLFGVNNGGAPSAICTGTRIYSLKIYSDSTYTNCVWDGRPCLYNGAYGMWDRISNTFFGNANNTGAFSGPPAKLYDWSNLTWLLVGDSLTEVNYRANTHYYDCVHDQTNISFINTGRSGKGYANGDYFYSVFHNLSNTAFSFATIFGSGNDVRYEAISSLSSAASWTDALGNINDSGTSTICGYINRAINEFQLRAPSKKIGIVTPTPWKNGSAQGVSLTDEETNNRLRTYSEKLVQIAQARGIPYLDLFNNSGLDPWDADFRDEYYKENGVLDDYGVHPNSKGHKLISSMFLSFLNQYLVQ